MTTQGSQRSNLALQVAPPPPPRRQRVVNFGILLVYAIVIFFGALGLAGEMQIHSGSPPTSHERYAIAACALVILLILTVSLVSAAAKKKRDYEAYAAVWPSMMHVWRNAMACQRCHGTFFPPGSFSDAPSGLIPIENFHTAVTEIGTRITLTSPSADPRAIPPFQDGSS